MVSDGALIWMIRDLWKLVSIRFEVRGGFRQLLSVWASGEAGRVSIRFEVRGGFRQLPSRWWMTTSTVSIRFEVRGGFRRV